MSREPPSPISRAAGCWLLAAGCWCRNTIAVLPFVDLSPGQDEACFSAGLAEERLNLPARVPELRVAARTSSSQAEIAREIVDALKVRMLAGLPRVEEARPLYDNLRRDPRWQVSLERAGVSDAPLAAIPFRAMLPPSD